VSKRKRSPTLQPFLLSMEEPFLCLLWLACAWCRWWGYFIVQYIYTKDKQKRCIFEAYPISLASGFLLSKVFLSESIRLRRYIHRIYQKKQKREDIVKNQRIYLIAPLWLDPANPDQNKIMQFLILLLPFVIFLLSIVMISYSWHYTPHAPSVAAQNLSRKIFTDFKSYVLEFSFTVIGR